MLNKKNSFLLAGLCVALVAFPLNAQLVQQGLRQVPRAFGKTAADAAGAAVWKNFPGTLPPAPSAAQSVQPRTPSWKAQFAKTYPAAVKAYEQKINKRSRQQALRRVVELRGLTPAKGWPLTADHSLTVPSLRGLTLDGYQADCPPLPIPTNKIYLYRGMGLAESALRNVLKNGLRAQDSGPDSNMLATQMRFAHMGTMPVSRQMLQDLDVRQTYLTPQAQETLHFAYMHSFEEGRIPVVVTVRGWRKNNSYHVVLEDIPPSDFVEVSALIRGPQGTPIWCAVSLAEDGYSFVFTPYVSKP